VSEKITNYPRSNEVILSDDDYCDIRLSGQDYGLMTEV